MSVSPSKASRWQEHQPVLLRRPLHQRFSVPPRVHVTNLASIIYSTDSTIFVRPARAHLYCEEGGLAAQHGAHFRVITQLRSLPCLSYMSSAQRPLSWFSTFSGCCPSVQSGRRSYCIYSMVCASPRDRTFQSTILDLTTNRGP
jgi:hypothetical protein